MKAHHWQLKFWSKFTLYPPLSDITLKSQILTSCLWYHYSCIYILLTIHLELILGFSNWARCADHLRKLHLIHGIIKLSMLCVCLAYKLRNNMHPLLHITDICCSKACFWIILHHYKEGNWQLLTSTTHMFLSRTTKIINMQGERQFVLENVQTKLIILSEKK